MTEYIWRVKADADYEDDASDELIYDVLAVDLTEALRKVAKLVPQKMEDEEGKPTLKLIGYGVTSAIRGSTLDA